MTNRYNHYQMELLCTNIWDGVCLECGKLEDDETIDTGYCRDCWLNR